MKQAFMYMCVCDRVRRCMPADSSKATPCLTAAAHVELSAEQACVHVSNRAKLLHASHIWGRFDASTAMLAALHVELLLVLVCRG